MSQWNSTEKRCVTCNSWSGTRTPVVNGKAVKADNQFVKGKCSNKASKKYSEINAVQNCNYWEKWSALS